MSTRDFDIVIAGAGHNSLACGAWLARSGLKVCVIERNSWIGGGCVTGGGVFFAGEANGYFRAYNAKTGKKLWEFQTGAGANAACALYELGGKLHVAVASGGNAQINSKRGNEIIAYKLK